MRQAQVRAAKAALRERVLAARAARSEPARAAAAAALATVFAAFLADLPEDARADPAGSRPDPAEPRSVAAYLSIGTEPSTAPLLERLATIGVEVIVPVLTADRDLDWTSFAAGDPVVAGMYGTLEPRGRRLGVDAIARVDIVLVPALAVDRRGRRLGRGGGSYDRALARLPAHRQVLAVVHDDEVVDEVPEQPHDQPVDGVVTPLGVLTFEPRPRG